MFILVSLILFQVNEMIRLERERERGERGKKEERKRRERHNEGVKNNIRLLTLCSTTNRKGVGH